PAITSTIPASSGLIAKAFYLDSSQPQYDQSRDFVTHGHMVNTEIFLANLNIPTHDYSTGLWTGGAGIKDNSGDLLVEWFGLLAASQIKLGQNDAAGDYQLALFADDGASLYLANHLLIGSEGLHQTTMACAQQVVSLNKNTRIPMQLTYFEGPRQKISLILMW